MGQIHTSAFSVELFARVCACDALFTSWTNTAHRTTNATIDIAFPKYCLGPARDRCLASVPDPVRFAGSEEEDKK
jgi:hypothetical protein